MTEGGESLKKKIIIIIVELVVLLGILLFAKHILADLNAIDSLTLENLEKLQQISKWFMVIAIIFAVATVYFIMKFFRERKGR
jgi:uncharacterized membrane protein